MGTTKPKLNKYGARVFLLPSKTLLVIQTIKRGRFVKDGNKEQFIPIKNTKAIATAIRKAVAGRLN
jgi:hypothetical protein